MFHQPEHYPNLSQRLSAVLDDIGVNEATVIKRRRAWMLAETLYNIANQLQGLESSSFFFGSQTEGSTTLGLKSDIDKLDSISIFSVIQDWSEWVKGKLQFLMVQDETTFPGYCLLQVVRPDLPLPEVTVRGFQCEYFIPDIKGRLLVRHASCLGQIPDGGTRHGPAKTDNFGLFDSDTVVAFHCSTWPKEAVPWLHQQNASGWPTEDMKRYSVEQGCFLVPVASRTGVYQDQEWRISTSLTERCLMFNINITQMRCYILMKMILKTLVQPKCRDAVSSFMCKNILFQCIAYSGANTLWNECTLLTRLKECLQALLNCILTENCPHFLIARNNLLAGKLSGEVKHQLVEVMCTLMANTEQSLLGIGIDDLGNRLRVKSSGISGAHLPSAYDIGVSVAFLNIINVIGCQQNIIKFSMKKLSFNSTSAYQDLTHKVSQLCQKYYGGPLEQMASSLITPFYCTIIGSTRASVDIQQSGVLSRKALDWFSLGLNSDVCTGKLKLASALYCAGELETCEILLLTLRRQMEQTIVQTICACYKQDRSFEEDFKKLCYVNNEHVIKNNMAFCVMYLPCEINCIPDELKYEMFRTTEEDQPYRDEDDDWMDWAVVDPLPYLFFLQYKVYGQLHRPADQHRALENLAWTIDNAPSLGHRETALNLLGQCVEQDGRKEVAFYCYMMSLNVRPTNNAAKWHLCRVLAGMMAQV